jgi:hypothetical protein
MKNKYYTIVLIVSILIAVTAIVSNFKITVWNIDSMHNIRVKELPREDSHEATVDEIINALDQ